MKALYKVFMTYNFAVLPSALLSLYVQSGPIPSFIEIQEKLVVHLQLRLDILTGTVV